MEFCTAVDPECITLQELTAEEREQRIEEAARKAREAAKKNPDYHKPLGVQYEILNAKLLAYAMVG